MKNYLKTKNLKLKITTVFGLFLFAISGVSAQSVDDLKSKIEDRGREIEKLDEEIKVYQGEINRVGAEANTLQSTIKTLDTNQKKISTEIKKTQVSIDKTNLSLDELRNEIKIIEGKIGTNSEAVAKSIFNLNQTDDVSIVETILNGKNLAEVWGEYQNIETFQQNVREKSQELSQHKEVLNQKKNEVEGKKTELVGLKSKLDDQNQVLSSTKKEKATLLTQTKNKESEYKKAMAEKQRLKEQFEKELYEYEMQLKIKVDPNSFPSSKKGILSWPVDNPFITQLFGRTTDAKRLYASGTHNGIDLRASIGTPIKTALSGTVEATGNTDTQAGCYSYGKWVLVKHDNGLSTLYAHLNLIKVSSGQKVSTGELIGYSGNTGYSTGPHLHLTVFASQGVIVQKYSQSKNCKNVVVPMARPEAYLDPMLYLPSL